MTTNPQQKTILTPIFKPLLPEEIRIMKKTVLNFVNDYSNYMVEKMRAAGATEPAIDATLQEMKQLKQMLDNPFLNAAMSFAEPLPVGLVITLISSLILRKKGNGPSPSNEPAQQ